MHSHCYARAKSQTRSQSPHTYNVIKVVTKPSPPLNLLVNGDSFLSQLPPDLLSSVQLQFKMAHVSIHTEYRTLLCTHESAHTSITIICTDESNHTKQSVLS